MARPTALLCLSLLALTSSGAVGCASAETRGDEARAARVAEREARPTPIKEATYEDDGASEMTVSGEEGSLNAADVEAALHEHMGEILQCYRLGRRTSQRAYGRVLLRFFVDGRGETQDVSVLESNLGNRTVERCLADIAVGVMFAPPAGHKPTTFEYPLAFRPARQLTASRQRRP